MDDLLQEFVSETRETLEALAGEIVAWEGAPGDRKRLDAIFRFVHTVKGSCGFLDLPRLARLSHAAEDALAGVRDGARVPDSALVDAVLAIVDRIGELVEAIASGVSLDDSSEELLIAALAIDAAPAAAAPVEVAIAPAMRRGASRTIRLGVDLLDRMMGGMSDMVLARNELARRLREIALDPQAEAALERLTATVGEMRDTVTRTRMQRIETLFAAVPRLVRDTAADTGKQVALTIDGGDVELDREMIELLRDPLVHMVRNAIDHGIEAPEHRRMVGKADTGRLTISARQSGNQIVVDIVDDGAGIDVARLCDKAVRSGLHSETAVAAMSDAARLDIIFAPGLSTRDTVTAVSGRGVGMDVVRANIEQIGGRVELANRPGQGLAVAIHVPLTLSIMSTVLISVDRQDFALPRQAVEEIVPVAGEAVRIDRIGDAAAVSLRGERLPLLSLGDILGLDAGAPRLLAVITCRQGRYALGIDQVLDVEELVIRPAAPAVMAIGIFAGQTLPDNGRPLLLLDASGIAAAGALNFVEEVRADVEADAAGEAATRPGLLFIDRDGRRRAIALAVVDRVEPVAAAEIADAGGTTYLSIGGSLVALHHVAPVVAGDPLVVLRLTDGEREVAYAIAEPLDIVVLPEELAAVAAAHVAGMALIDGEAIEIIDAYALFAAVEPVPARRPICLLHGDDSGWMAGFLAPTLEAAGYRCVSQPPPGERVALALTMDDTGPPPDVPCIRLTGERDATGGIYRYDRPALMAAIAGRRTAAGGRA